MMTRFVLIDYSHRPVKKDTKILRTLDTLKTYELYFKH
jgi:hypothetical protein